MNARVASRLTLIGVDDRLDRPLVMAPSGAFLFRNGAGFLKGPRGPASSPDHPVKRGPSLSLSGVGVGRDRNHPKHRERAIPPYHDMVALGRTT